MSDVFTKFNEVLLQLQGNNVKLIKVKSAISTLAHHELSQCPSLSELEQDKYVLDNDLQMYCAHLDELHTDTPKRFQNLLLLSVPDWVVNPFLDAKSEEAAVAALKEKLVSTQNDIEFGFKKSYQDFWLHEENIRLLSSTMDKVKMSFIAFPTS